MQAISPLRTAASKNSALHLWMASSDHQAAHSIVNPATNGGAQTTAEIATVLVDIEISGGHQ